MAIVAQNFRELEVKQDRIVTSQFGVVTTDLVTIHSLLWFDGEGYRPLSPSGVTVNEVAKEFPLMLSAGSHVVKLAGVTFDGTNMLVVGANLLAVVELTLGNVNAIAVDAVLQGLAQVPGYLEIDGPPSDADGKNGDRRFDRIGKIRYYKSENEWRQE